MKQISPDCSLTEKIGNNYIWTDTSWISWHYKKYPVQENTACSMCPLSAFYSRADIILRVFFYQRCGLQQNICWTSHKFLLCTRLSQSTWTRRSWTSMFGFFFPSSTLTNKQTNKKHRMSCWQLLCAQDHWHFPQHTPAYDFGLKYLVAWGDEVRLSTLFDG